ncbi:MarR family winged helix-turn-helix transcriptional regulator [Rhodoligotrophos defluvii]|uniref:MarR family winged helix-turn-helix transcriptional regulator n=1 Tax=Rhodoligotrophos defluvii TaxID=2561934 RepID=UPI0010C9A4F7|nr:MarR family transcriptional regulator [Rhodoligotrophos defluvii]
MNKKAKVAPSAEPVDRHSANELNNRLFFRLIQAGNIYHRQAMRELRITGVQGAVLGALSQDLEHGMPFSKLADYMGVSRQNLDAVLKRLERMDLVERVEKPEDRRVRLVRLTPAGLHYWNDLFKYALIFYEQAASGLTHQEKMLFLDLISRIARGLRSVDLSSFNPVYPPSPRKRRSPKASGA